VVFAPGNVFSASQSAAGFLRFNVSQCNRPKVYEELQRAMDVASAATDRERV
jgi:DNA-binding transcriptional MocR family regulator